MKMRLISRLPHHMAAYLALLQAIVIVQIIQLAHSSAIDTSTDVSVTSSISRSAASSIALKHPQQPPHHHSPYGHGRRRGSYHQQQQQHNDSSSSSSSAGAYARPTATRSYSAATTPRSIPTVVVGAPKDSARKETSAGGYRSSLPSTATVAPKLQSQSSAAAQATTQSNPTTTITTTSSAGSASTTTDSSGASSGSSKVRKRADKLHSAVASSAELTLPVTNTIVNQTESGSSHDGSHREALAHEGSEPVVYLSDSAGYIPVTPIRSSRHPQSSPGSASSSSQLSADYHAAPSSYGGGAGVDLEQWRPELWDRDYSRRYRDNNTRVQHIEAECQDDYMKIRVGFNGSFTGLLYSAGYAYDPDCMYVNGSGRDYYEFFIQLNRCGTLGKNSHHDDARKNPTKNFMWNTITVQYNSLIEEEFDEHFKVTCEYGYDFWKTVTFPFLDVEVATGNPVVFTLSPPECYMEIRNGYGPSGTRVAGPVRVGDPLTLIIYMRSKYDGFDIVVNDCVAHNGANKRIQLIDDLGCPVDDKLISRFRGSWSESGVYETQVYAYLKTFRFTGSPALYIECDVRMCHGRCPSQPCHWRNLKSVAKRDVSNNTLLDGGNKETVSSDNISLFQSLRVLQEDDGGEEEAGGAAATGAYDGELSGENNGSRALPNETCLRTATFSGLLIGFSVLVCVMSASLMVACAKLKSRKAASIYDSYVNHKGQID